MTDHISRLKELEDKQAARRRLLLDVMRADLEPQAREAMLEEIGPLSMAISMKRIADFICGSPSNSDAVDYLARRISELRY